MAACTLVLMAVAAPALSLERHAAVPVEFELAAPGGPPVRAAAAAGRSARGLVSPVIRAPRRFNLVGLRWRGPSEAAIAIRVRDPRGRWGRWTPVPAHTDGAPDPGQGEAPAYGVSAPVWAGEAEYVQYRLSEPLPGLRLRFVNTTGTATRSGQVRSAVRAAAGRALAALGDRFGARAQAAAPLIVPRAAWGGQHCPPRDAPSYGEVKAAFVHHTVTANDYTPEQAPAAVLAICRYHHNTNGWDDIGYNFLVDKYGTIYEGRAGGIDRPVVGAQAQGFNAQTTGIANLGTHTALPQTEAALEAMAALIRWKLPLHGQPTAGTVPVTSAGGATNRYPAGTEVLLQRVAGHRDGNNTACPGEALHGQLPRLRSLVGGVAPPVAARTRIEAAVQPPVVRFSEQARVTGSLRKLTGEPLSDAPVEIQAFAGGAGWRTVAGTATGLGGAFQALVTPSAKRVLRARYPGGQALLASTSRQAVVKVRATLTATRSTSRVRVGETPVIAGRIGPRKRRVLVIVERRLGGRNLRVARAPVPAPGGRFRKAFRMLRPGLVRFLVLFPGDAAHLPAQARPLYVRVLGGGRSGAR